MPNFLYTLAASDPDQHVYNHPFFVRPDGLWVWSGVMGNLVLSGLIVILVGLWVASKIKTGPANHGTTRYITTNRFAHMIEVICVYLREEICRPLLKDRTDRMMPLLWTVFFFILVNNLLGLLPIMDIVHLIRPDWAAAHITPIGGTATQSIWVTGALALLAGIIFNGAALKRLGLGGYIKHLTGGTPWYLWPLIVLIEFAGQIIIKPGALAIRLFANMTAGHILLAALLGFVAVAVKAIVAKEMNPAGAVGISFVSALGAIAIMFLELFVAFLQAFIFMFLIAVFTAVMDHDEHGHEHESDHAPGHEHAHA